MGLPASGPASYDMVFYGNPGTPSHTLTHPHTPSHTPAHPHTPSNTLTGTGKTSVARLVPAILQAIPNPHP